jgi:glycosyltransferase involved in cell wall biosynthesis
MTPTMSPTNQISDAVAPLRVPLHAPEILASVVMPCLNEAETLAICIDKARSSLQSMGVSYEIIVGDNGSTDGSQEIATKGGAIVVAVSERGYGAALMGAIEHSHGKYIVMADADDSYDLGDIPSFVNKLNDGADLVMGNRFQGGIAEGAMPFLHKYLGNPVLSFIGRLFFKAPCKDFHCGMRAFTRAAYDRMKLRTLGMEFASEMVVKSTLLNLRFSEVPTKLAKDGRSRAPHLRTWRDGWRHLRFLLMYSPRWLFLYPGIAMTSIGVLATIWLMPGTRTIGSINLDVHTMLYALMFVVLGVQAITFATLAKTFAVREGLVPQNEKTSFIMSYFSLELGLVLGALLMFAGAGFSIAAVHMWSVVHYGALNVSVVLRLVAPAVILFTVGVHVVLSSFMLSLMGIERR